MSIARRPSPSTAVALLVVLGLCSLLLGVYLLAGLPVALITFGVLAICAGLVADV